MSHLILSLDLSVPDWKIQIVSEINKWGFLLLFLMCCFQSITTTVFKTSCSEKRLHVAVMDFLTFLRGAVDKLNVASSCIILAFETSLCGNNICRVILFICYK